MEKISFGGLLRKIVIIVVCSFAFWGVFYLIAETMFDKIFGWGWWLESWAMVLQNIVLFAPAVVTTVYWIVTLRKTPGRMLAVILLNPVLILSVLWHIFIVLTASLPT